MRNCISNEQKEYIEQIEKDMLERTNMTEQEAVDFAFRCWQCGYAKTSENNGWIPCSERLPEKRDWYLAVFQEVDTGFIGLPFIADYLMGVHTKYTTEDGWIIANCTDIEEDRAEYYKKLKCIAWQPLPEPYKECER